MKKYLIIFLLLPFFGFSQESELTSSEQRVLRMQRLAYDLLKDSRHDGMTFEEFIKPVTPQTAIAVKSAPGWEITHFRPDKANETISLKTPDSSNTKSLELYFEPSSGCTQTLIFMMKPEKRFDVTIHQAGKVTYKFDDDELASASVNYFANEGERTLGINLTSLTPLFLKRDQLILRLDSVLEDAPAFRFSMSNAAAAASEALQACKNTITYQLR